MSMDTVPGCLCKGIEQQYRALVANRALLGGAGEQEALHDLRVALRSLRSLTRPWRKADWCEEILCSASAFGQRSGPWRDLEVLCVELAKQGQDMALSARSAALETGYLLLREDPLLPQLEQQLENFLNDAPLLLADWPAGRMAKQLIAELMRLRRRLDNQLSRKSLDLHRVRILVKRLRYLLQAFAPALAMSPELLTALQQCQSSLGDWHDRWQWLQRSQVEQDLRPLTKTWQRQLEQYEKQARRELKRLNRYTGTLFRGSFKD
ncbi:CHAD domain-containing protein [Halopseudomonas phragmitis]|nr:MULTISPECIES: CHAD domain-containing protein [Pseudomonadaceae]